MMVFCAELSLLRTGRYWRALPGDFPKWRTVHARDRAQRLKCVLDHGRTERQEHGYDWFEGL
ncbi:transposase [Lampropedia aestuarii]|uniref:Transposase n=1 Tax=Lampropedia aestuarii TaxID=2562762 RepID=A0A4S5BM28_9BURK|nr:transposase [Lampropedia aestuarii]